MLHNSIDIEDHLIDASVSSTCTCNYYYYYSSLDELIASLRVHRILSSQCRCRLYGNARWLDINICGRILFLGYSYPTSFDLHRGHCRLVGKPHWSCTCPTKDFLPFFVFDRYEAPPKESSTRTGTASIPEPGYQILYSSPIRCPMIHLERTSPCSLQFEIA
jgi:hypothetical protein